MGRLTTLGVTAPDPAARARAAIGTALGIVSPTAVPLRDGRVWLTSRQDVLPARVVRALAEQLGRRAADKITDERMLAEAVAVLGAEIARTRGEPPETGATDALDRLLQAPGLDRSRRVEAEAMLRLALRLAAQESAAAAARLRSLPGATRVPVASEIVSASERISQDASRLSTTNQPAPAIGRTGRHRAQVGVRHHRQTLTREISGRTPAATQPGPDPRESEQAALAALTRLDEDQLGSSVTSRPTVDGQSGLAAITLSSGDSPQYFRVEVAPVVRGLAAQGRLASGTANDPHVLRIKPGLPPHQYGEVWIHQLSLMSQEQQAARAGRSTGILRKLRSAVSHERLNRRTNADLAVYRKLSADWQLARDGRPNGPLSVAELERDLERMSEAIGRRSGAAPELPWANDSTYSPAAAADGLAAERAIAATKAEPGTRGQLRQKVVEQIASLESAVADLEIKATGWTESGAAAADQATTKQDLAVAEDNLKDLLAPDRARRLRNDATAAFAKARRHVAIADAYEQAAKDAGKALAGYRVLLNRLDDPDAQPQQIAEQAREAAEMTGAYQASLRNALPVDHLESGVPTDRRLALPVEAINRQLAENGSSRRIADRGPVPVPGAQYRRLFSDGMVFTVGGDPDDDVGQVAQVRVRLKARDLTEVTGLDYTVAEQMSGSLGEGGQSNSITATHSSSVGYGVDLQPFMVLAPEGSAVRAASQVVSPRVDVTTGQTLSATSGATAHSQLGWVDVFKGESVPYSWNGTFEIEVRNSPTEPWSPVRTADAGEQLTWVPSPYTVQAPAETVTLEQLGRGDERTTEFPRHTVTRINGLHAINDRVVAQTRQRFGKLDRVGFDHISELLTEDPYRLLREAAKPGGLSRTIPVGGESEYQLTLEVQPVWSRARLVGACTSEMGQEKVQVDFAGFNASRSSGTSLSASATVTYPGKMLDPAQPVPGYLPSPTALNDLGESTADLSPNVSAGRNVSRHGGQNLSTTAITPVVDRDMAPTQGVLVDLRVTATLRKLRDPKAEPIVVTDTCEAKLRLTANRLLRTGAPAGKDAVLRDDDNAIRLDQDGRALLLGDPEPPTGPQTLPPFHGTGENQLRGPGKSLPEQLEGVDEARQQALTSLSRMGLVPPLDADHRPRWDELPSDPRRRAGQLANYDRVMQDITDYRIAAGMNSACQSGLVVPLVDHRTGHAPRTRLFRLSTTQDFDDVQPAGTTWSRVIARLGISSRGSQQTGGRSKAVPLSAGLGLSNGPGEGQQGLAGKVGIKGSRNALGRVFSWSIGRRINRVTLTENTGGVDNLRQGIRITFGEMTGADNPELLADVRGSVVLPYDSSLARAEEPVFAADPKTPHRDAVSRSIPVAVDAGDPADELFRQVDAIRADTVAYLQLHTALSPESLVSNTEWLEGRYELPLVITPPPANPSQALADRTLLPQELKVVLRSEVVSQTVVAVNDQNTADINFTMNDAGHSSGTSASGGVGGEAGGGSVDADQSAANGKLSAGRTAGTSQSTSTYQTTGEERLRVNDGVHYELIERHRLVAEIIRGDEVVQTVPLPDAKVQKAIPEYTALELYGRNRFDLPLPFAADVAERYLTGKVDLSPRTAAGFVRRYKQEKAGVTTGLAAEHTDERLNTKLLDRAGLPASTAPTPEDRLANTLVRTQQLAETRRVVGLPEQYDASLASSQLYAIKIEGHEDQDVDLIPQLREQVEEVSPGLLDSDPLLGQILEVDLSQDSYQGQLENMLGPRGYTTPIEVPVEGQAQSDLLLVTVKARFEGDVTVDGGPLTKAAAIGLVQKYSYTGRDRSTTHTTTYSGSAEVSGNGDGGSLSGGLGTDRIRSVSAGSGEQNTRLDRTGDFDLTPVNRTVVFTTEVRRIHSAGTAAMSSVRWRLSRTAPAARSTTARPRELRAELTALVPRGLVSDPPVAAEQAAQEFHPDHRSAEMPVSSPAESMLPYRKGAQVADELYNSVTGHLAGVLGSGGLAQYEAALGVQLQPTALQARFSELTSPGGVKLEPMMGRGNGRTRFDVRVNARRLGWILVTPEPVPGQTGLVQRDQHQTKTSTAGNHLLPATATVGASGGIVSVTGSVGEQVKTQSNDAWGTRLETSAFRNGDIVTVRVPVVYDVTVDEVTDNGRGTPETKDTTVLKDAATAEFYVRMQYHEYLEGLRQLEAGGDVSLESGRLRAMPEKLGRPDLRMSEAGPDGSHQPYRPLLLAIDKAKAEEKPVVLSVKDKDGGNERLYTAFPDGTLRGQNDGGFATAFATLDRNLVLMAEGRVDLRELYNTSEPGTEFSTNVAAALEQSGVPTAMLKGLTHSTAQRQTTPPPTHAAKPPRGAAAASRTITPTAGGPSLTGP